MSRDRNLSLDINGVGSFSSLFLLPFPPTIRSTDMVGSEDELWAQLECLNSMQLLSLSDSTPHQHCTPSVHFKDKRRTVESPGQGPFYVVTSGLKLGVFDDWCVSYILILFHSW